MRNSDVISQQRHDRLMQNMKINRDSFSLEISKYICLNVASTNRKLFNLEIMPKYFSICIPGNGHCIFTAFQMKNIWKRYQSELPSNI